MNLLWVKRSPARRTSLAMVKRGWSRQRTETQIANQLTRCSLTGRRTWKLFSRWKRMSFDRFLPPKS
uniref:Uncharacterized protein n=1 Tax=Anguilla anguilla TaxID=7936 RepID=A0A0E9QIR5_ANGAN